MNELNPDSNSVGAYVMVADVVAPPGYYSLAPLPAGYSSG
jgi:hypothetical protein